MPICIHLCTYIYVFNSREFTENIVSSYACIARWCDCPITRLPVRLSAETILKRATERSELIVDRNGDRFTSKRC